CYSYLCFNFHLLFVSVVVFFFFFFFSSRRRHTRCYRDWSSDVCSSDLSLRGSAFKAGDFSANDSCEEVVFESHSSSTEKTSAERSEERRVGKECRYRR